MKKSKNTIIIILIVLSYLFINFGLVLLLPILSYHFSKVEINEDIEKYNDYMGQTAKEQYINKWGMDETIFPKKITKDMNVIDYKMVYYDPWDAQYLSYLVIDYDEENYIKEVERLKNYKSTKFIGYYNVTGFTKYNLLAMYADLYQGFVYAITDNKNRIIYVELIFCNYFYDINYKKYINEDYLPDGFDATLDNSYQKSMLKNNY